MNRSTANRLALVMFGTLAFSGVALAQDTEAEFVVSSTRASGLARGSLASAPVEVISVSQRVSYADLNLASSAGSRAMEERIWSTARTLCEKLDQKYPLAGVEVQTCTRETFNKGMSKVRTAQAAAEKNARTASLGSRE